MSSTGSSHSFSKTVNNRIANRQFDPPDGGYGWCVMFGSFLIFVLLGGVFYSFGVLYVALLDSFNASNANTALVGTFSCSMGIIGNGVSMTLCNRYGHRKILMVSGICSSIGFVICSFTTSLRQIYVVYGVFISFLYWITSFPAISMIREYFSKKMPMAIGLALSGTGAGQCIFSILTQILLDNYGWRGTLIVLGGTSLHFCLAGALFRPTKYYYRLTKPPAQYTKITERATTFEDTENHDLYVADKFNQRVSNPDDSDSNFSEKPAATTVQLKKKASRSCCITGLRNLQTVFKSMCDLPLFRNVVFLLLILSVLGSTWSQYIVIVHMVNIQENMSCMIQ
ncbi:monocarboxylate transporter 11-like [Saccoglossus kowalevskii]